VGLSIAGCGSNASSAHKGTGAETGEPDASADGAGEVLPDGAPSVVDGAVPVMFTIDVAGGPGRQRNAPPQPAPVSPYIYGINALDGTGHSSGLTQQKTRWGLVRKGGNSMTAWNWTNNYQNLGDQECYWQGQAIGGAAIAGAVTGDADPISAVQAEGAALVATVSIVDHVAAAFTNDTLTGNLCPAMATCMQVAAPSDGVNVKNLDFASVDPTSTAFVPNAPAKPGAYCTCAPSGCAGGCSMSTSPVYQDEFVAFMRANYGGSGAPPIFFDLDNEPNYWGGTHPEVWPVMGTVPCESSTVTYDDIVSRDETYAAAVKKAWPTAKVLGPVVSQDGIVFAHSYANDPHASVEFVDYYLAQMASASAEAGTPLLDALDVHYYNEGTSDPSQCVQNPRMFWDSQYTDITPAAVDAIDFGWAGVNAYFDSAWYPRAVVPRLMNKIATAYPSGGPGLSFSEYNSGCEKSIAGGIAEADDLGIFGREGVFAAAAMPLSSPADNYLVAAFDLYRNYDGNGAVVGDTAVRAVSTDIKHSSVYAFAHSDKASQFEIVAINKSTQASPSSFAIANAPSLTTATAYVLASGHAGVVPAIGTPATVQCNTGSCMVSYTMPPMSATTIALR
jgi:hypothetical protein